MTLSRRKIGLVVALAIIVVTSIHCGNYTDNIKAQSQSGSTTNTGVQRIPESALQGQAAGKESPFNPTGEDLKAAIYSHPPPEVWLVFHVSGKQGQSQSSSSDKGESAVRVDLPIAAQELLLSHWRVSLSSNYEMDIAGVPNAQSYGDQMVTIANSFQNVAAELMKVQIDAPDGRRTISQDEANDLTKFMGAAARNIIEQAKPYKK